MALTVPIWSVWPASILVREDNIPGNVDGIIMLSGDIIARLPAAADLYKRGVAPRILFAKVENYYLRAVDVTINETDVAARHLAQDYGVPTDAVDYVKTNKPVTSTREEADVLADHIKTVYPMAKRFVVVTTWFHTSRAHWIFAKEARRIGLDITYAMMPAYPKDFTIASWWHHEDSFLLVFTEYLKWLFYLINY